MLSGRYRTDQLVRHFTESDGFCTLCKDCPCPGTIEHLLLKCSALTNTRKHLLEGLVKSQSIRESTKSLVLSCLDNDETAIQLILDSSVLPKSF